jgi:hypothetical protein
MEEDLHREIEDHLALVPERNHLEHTSFMNKLQIHYYLEEINEKEQRLKTFKAML